MKKISKSHYKDGKIRIAILTNVIPTYREAFYDLLLNNQELEVSVYCQNEDPKSKLKTINSKYIGEKIIISKYSTFLRKNIVWQHFPYTQIFHNYDIIFFDGNPRNLSQSIFASIAKLLGRKIILWSTVHSHRNHALSEKIRLTWWRMFNYFLMYVESDIHKLKELGFKKCIIKSINNGLNQKKIDQIISTWNDESIENWKIKEGLVSKKILISSARLEQGRFNDMLGALPKLIKNDESIIWCIIGFGSDYIIIKDKIEELGISRNVRMLGAIYEEELLAPWFLSAKIMIHTCAIGLSIMHAFGYGLPIITHNSFSEHGPEIAVFQENVTGISYKKGNYHDLYEKIYLILRDNNLLVKLKKGTKKIVQFKYNTNQMYDNFVEISKNVFDDKKFN